MYSTCIFCHSRLGTNEAIEHFPVGRKLAFDAAKGRLWAVCGKCGRWNLTPIEERWEAIEECERQYRGTVMRASTDHIGLGRVREGTDLVRIGEPLRPEFAAWRYGRYFERRRRVKLVADVTGLVASLGVIVVGGVAMSVAPLISAGVARALHRKSELEKARRFIVQRAELGFNRTIWKHESVGVRIFSTPDNQGWGIRFALDAKFLDFLGSEALHIAQLVAPAMNVEGAKPSHVDVAVREIERAGSADLYFRRILKYGETRGWKYSSISEYPEEMRLAFEMAAHEQSERVAMEGELAQLESDWREAEEIAAIADNLFLPKSVTDFMERHRRN